MLVSALVMVIPLCAQLSKTVDCVPGMLNTLLTDEDKNTITNLTLNGIVDQRDFVTMRDSMPNLAVIDMRTVIIEAFDVYPANEIPAEAFFNRTNFQGKPTLTSVVFPSSLVSIGKQAFLYCYYLTGTLQLPNLLSAIGEGAFSFCSNLTDFYVESENATFSSVDGILYNKNKTIAILCPNGKSGSVNLAPSLISIAEYAFRYCTSISDILVFPPLLETIKKGAFWGCSGLSSLDLPASLISVEENAFYFCTGLSGSLFFPSGLSNIHKTAFWNCGSLTDFNVDPGNTMFCSIDGIIYSNDKSKAILCPQGKTGSIMLPSTLTSVNESAFFDCKKITGITFPESVRSIGDAAFRGCSGLTSLNLPPRITNIGYLTFYLCSGLTGNLKLPPALKTIGINAFKDCTKLSGIDFSACHSLISIDRSFINCKGLTQITLPPSLTNIGYFAFQGCSGLIKADLLSCSSLTVIGNGTFTGCSLLNSVYLPTSILRIDQESFSSCTSLQNIYCPVVTPPYLGSNVFSGVNVKMVVAVPLSSVAFYQLTATWKQFKIVPLNGIFGINPQIGMLNQNYGSVEIKANPVKTNARVVLFNESSGIWLPDSISRVDSFTIRIYLDFSKAAVGMFDIWLINGSDTIKKAKGYALINDEILFGKWIDFESEPGEIFTGSVTLPNASRIYCLIKKRNAFENSIPWVGGINVFFSDKTSFSSSLNTGTDICLTLLNVKSGTYPFEVYSDIIPGLFFKWGGKIKFCIEPDTLLLNEWGKGEILRSYGYDWKVMEVPENVDTLTIRALGFGSFNTLDVYRNFIGNMNEHWSFSNNWKDPVINGKIPGPSAGRYFIKYVDSQALNSSNQFREYFIHSGTETGIPESPQELIITGLSADTLAKGLVTVNVIGRGIRKTDKIRLNKENVLSIEGFILDSLIYNDHTFVRFDLSEAEEGEWYISVLRDSAEINFEIVKIQVVDDKKIDIDFRIIASEAFRTGQFRAIVVTLTNNGKTDLHLIPVTLTIPKTVMVEVRNLKKFEYDTLQCLFDPNNIPLGVSNLLDPNLQDITIIVPSIALRQNYELVFWIKPLISGKFKYEIHVDDPMLYPGIAFYPLTLKSSSSSDECTDCINKMDGWIKNQFEDLKRQYSDLGEDFFKCVEFTNFYEYLKKFIADNETAQVKYPIDYSLFRAAELIECLKFSNSAEAVNWFRGYSYYLKEAQNIFNCFDICNNGEKDEEYPKNRPGNGEGFGAIDPEDKFGPLGATTLNTDSTVNHYIQVSEPFEYRIECWNREDATAPAVIVFIRDTLDTDFNLNTFNFTQVGFLKWKVNLTGGQYFNINVDCRPDMPYIVNIEGTLDPISRLAKWVYTTLDPLTGNTPDDPFAGFLPPIDSTGTQICWAGFTVEANDSLTDGTVFSNRAYTNFDGFGPWGAAPQKAPYTTVYDLSPPVSKMLTVPLICETDSVLLTWTGTDTGSGVKDYTIYVSDSDTIYAWKLNTADTASYFKGENGITYNFHSIARDRVGNREPNKQDYETSVTFLLKDSTQFLTFFAGWNIFSIYQLPGNSDLKTVFKLLIDNSVLVKIQDEKGNALEDLGFFGGWTNNIGDISLTDGYKIKVKTDCQLKITGSTANLPVEIPLISGWNIIGYPRQSEADAMAVVQPLIDRGTLVKVQDEKGYAIEDYGFFGGWQNGIDNFKPGKGYKIKVSAIDTLTIYESYPKSSASPMSHEATVHFIPAVPGNGVDHMNINLVGIPEGLLEEGDELGVFDGELCVGAYRCKGQRAKGTALSIAATAFDETGDKGFTEGNRFIMKLWKARTNREFLIEQEVISGPSTFIKHESVFIRMKESSVSGIFDNLDSKVELTVYPNPTDGKVYIYYSGSFLNEINLSVLDALGQRVLDQTFNTNPGIIDMSGNVSGIYYIRVTNGSCSKTEKFILR